MKPKYIIIGILLITLIGNASATTRTVCASGCDYTNIGAAETGSGSGDIIYVYNGTYTEDVTINVPHLTIQGESWNVNVESNGEHTFNVDASYCNITNMNITGAPSSKANIHLDGAFTHCNFSYNRIADSYDGIVVRGVGNSHNLILNNTFRNCSDVGIMVRDTSYTNVTENNMFYMSYPLYFRDTVTDTYVYSNWIKHCTRGIWQLGTAVELVIYNNYFYNNTVNGVGGTADTVWNLTKRSGTNIFGGDYIGGNYWDDYAGIDNDSDGLGNTLLPYTSGGQIVNGGDYLPLTVKNPVTYGCNHDICCNQNGWWRDGHVVNMTSTPISYAISNATQGQTVYVYNGTYVDNIDESDTSHLTVIGEGRGLVHVTPLTTNLPIFKINGDADHFNISGIHGSGGISGCIGVYFLHVTHGNIFDCNFSNMGTHGLAGEHGNYMRVVNNVFCNNTLRGSSFPYHANNSYFADNLIMDNGGRGLDICTHGDNSTFKNNTVLRNGIVMGGTHYSGINTHWGNNIIYDECRSYGNYGFRDHLIRNDANNITIRNPANAIGEALDFDIEDNDCDWRITNTDGQIFTETSGAVAYSYPTNFSMNRENVIETFTVLLTPMMCLSTDDRVSVSLTSYNNAAHTEYYNASFDCTDNGEIITYRADVANNTGNYDCYIDNIYNHSTTSVAGIVEWEYNGGFSSPVALSIMPGADTPTPPVPTDNTFESVIDMLKELVNTFGALLNVVIKIIPLCVAIVIASFVVGLLVTLLAKIRYK